LSAHGGLFSGSGGGCGEEKGSGEKESPQPPTPVDFPARRPRAAGIGFFRNF